jgi:nucleotide-binding universal stress UspA family protein
MSGVILALPEHAGTLAAALAAARGLAALMGSARINVLAIRLPPEATITGTEEILTRHREAQIRAGEEARAQAMRAVFEPWAATARAPGIAIDWIDVEGLADAVIAEWGRRADYLVIDRVSESDAAAHRLALNAALFDTDRPVLVVPPGPAASFGAQVAIAWRDDMRTDRAVLAALRLLSRASEVHVLAGVRDGAAPPVLPAILAEHGIAAKLHVLPIGSGVFGEALLAHAHALGADLLVMGAYTHSPWRELLLGGVTRHVLSHATLPVLMRH